MKAFVFFFFAILAMAAANRVHVVDHNPDYNPGQVHVVNYNPDYNPGQVHVVDHNPDYNPGQVHVVDHNPDYYPGQVHVVDHNPDYNPGQVHVVDNSGVTSDGNSDHVVIANPDPFFSQPSNGPSGNYEPISTGPAFVDFNHPNYPPKRYDNPLARGGK